MNPIGKLETVLWDVRYALRQILRSPGFTAVAITLLALGIGANVALFTIIQAIEFRPAPGLGNTSGAVRIVPILINSRGRYPASGGRGSYQEYLAYREQRETFVDVAAWTEGNATLNLGAGNSSARLIFASSGYFTTLRLKMALGSGFSPQADDRGEVSPVAVASHEFWKRDLDGATNVMGRQVTIGNARVTIIGVAPPRFNGVDYTDNAVDLFLPLGLYPVIFPGEQEKLTDPNESDISYAARLRPGVTAEKATAVVATVASRVGSGRRPSSQVDVAFGGARLPSGARAQGGGERYTAETAPLLGSRPTGTSELGEIFAVFSTIGLFILLITCTNVSNMLVGRAMGRRKEMGVRLALGAARGRIIRQLLTESSVLAVLATILAMVLIHIILRVVFYFAGAVLPDLTPTAATILFASSVAIGTGVVFGLAPALHASNAPVSEVLKSGGGGGIDRRRSRLQGAFVVAQLALTIPALVVAGMAVGFVVASAAAKTGIDESEKVLTVPLQLQSTRFGAREASALATQTKHRVRAIPGVTHVALASALPAAGTDNRPGWTVGREGVQVRGGGFVRLDNPSVLTSGQVRPSYLRVDPDFFAIAGIPIRRGRAIQATDIKGAPFVVVVSEDFAQHVWPNENPLGKSLVRGTRTDTTFTVVGVAGIVRRMGTPAPTVYGAREQRADSALDGRSTIREGDVFVPAYSTTMLVRMDRAADPMVAAVQAAVREVDAGIRIVNPRTLAARRENQLNELLLLVYAAFAAAAVLMTLSSIGIYAIVSHGVTQRTREIGVRIALGARSHQVIGLFIKQGVVLTLIGLSIGLPLAIGGIKLSPLSSELPQQGHSDIYGIAGMVVVLILVAAFASWLPARQAARVDPLTALRAE